MWKQAREVLRERTAFALYVGATVVAGVGVLVSVVLTEDLNTLAGPVPSAFWIFAALLLLAELNPIDWLRKRDGGEVTASWTFALALLLVTPSNAALLVTAAACLLSDLLQRKPPNKMFFNAAQVTLSLGAGALVLGLSPYRHELLSTGPLPLGYLPVVALAGITVFLLNGTMTCTVLALHNAEPVWASVRANAGRNLSTDGMLLALSPVFVVVAQRSLTLLPLLFVTSYAVYNSVRLALHREHVAMHDALTGLPNRRLFDQQAAASLAEARRRGQQAAVVQLDLNGFKEINDRLGHHLGDLVLREIGQRLRDTVRATDLVARLGGDEFGMLLRSGTGPTGATELVERLRTAVEAPCVVDGFPLTVGASFGIAAFPDHGQDVEALIERADVAMYRAKHSGGGVVEYDVHSRDRTGRGRLGLLGDLQNAITAGELRLHYQPKADLRTGKLVGVEALLRWEHPTLGLVAPDDFMPLAEQTELMGPLTDHVVDLALRQCAEWRREGLQLPVAVNLSARNLHDLRFPSMVAARLAEAGLAASWLELEITENTVMADPTRSMDVLRELAELGVGLSIDDFGTGYSSLANLRDLPIGTVKIDRSFVTTMTTVRGDAVIVRSIIELARNLELKTIAEGVEDLAVWQLLRDLGCDAAQGYFLSRPLPAAEIPAWVARADIPAPAAPVLETVLEPMS